MQSEYRAPEAAGRLGRMPLLYLVFGLLLVGAAMAAGSFWAQSHEHFPKLSAGHYVGYITGVEEGRHRLPIYIQSQESSGNLMFAVLASGWAPQILTPVTLGNGDSDTDFFLPLIVGSENLRFKLVGECASATHCAGKVYQQPKGRRGEWEFTRKEVETGTGPQTSLEQWLRLRQALLEIDRRIAEAEKMAESQKGEIERLTDIVTEGKGLKAKADQKFDQVSVQLKALREKLRTKQQEVDNLEGQIAISQRVTPMGKLVSLARETLEREARWVESMLSGNPSRENMERVDAEFSKAQKLFDLKRQIASEQDRIDRLASAPDLRPGLEGPR
ncbi:MAG: hypothetical protein K1X83_10360 [Oligoflexia bacterium]|nr:hypothetical protein [Oligoflexia bacterium]